jgi:outer membrane protein OmpA-like peptidoglycan-associated protein
MGSHTDTRGIDQYNLVLSDKRAMAAVKYLISQGIDASRLTFKGYGEKVLVNGCKNDVTCSEEDHQKNRRTEFKVTKIRK